MLPQLILVLGAVLAAWMFMSWLKRTRPDAAGRIGKMLALAVLGAFGLWLVMTGKLAGLFALGAAAMPWLSRAARVHGWWRAFERTRRGEAAADAPPPPSPVPPRGMTEQEARDILGVGPDCSPDDIRAAHRRLMLANHPDHGGSTWIAARINQARDVLLG